MSRRKPRKTTQASPVISVRNPLDPLNLDDLIHLFSIPESEGTTAIAVHPVLAYVAARRISRAQEHGILAAEALYELKQSKADAIKNEFSKTMLSDAAFTAWKPLLDDLEQERNQSLFTFLQWLESQPYHRLNQLLSADKSSSYDLGHLLADYVLSKEGLQDTLGIKRRPGAAILQEMLLRPSIERYLARQGEIIPCVGDEGIRSPTLQEYAASIIQTRLPLETATTIQGSDILQKSLLILVDNTVRQKADEYVHAELVNHRRPTHYQAVQNVLRRIVTEQASVREKQIKERRLDAYRLHEQYLQYKRAFRTGGNAQDIKHAEACRVRASEIWRDLHDRAPPTRRLEITVSGETHPPEISSNEVSIVRPGTVVDCLIPVRFLEPQIGPMVREVAELIEREAGKPWTVDYGISYSTTKESGVVTRGESGPKFYTLLRKARELIDAARKEHDWKPRHRDARQFVHRMVQEMIYRTSACEAFVSDSEIPNVNIEPINIEQRLKEALEIAEAHFDLTLSDTERENVHRGFSLIHQRLTRSPFFGTPKLDPSWKHFLATAAPIPGNDTLHQEGYDLAEVIAANSTIEALDASTRQLDLEKLRFKTHPAEGLVQILEHPDLIEIKISPDETRRYLYQSMLWRLDPKGMNPDIQTLIKSAIKGEGEKQPYEPTAADARLRAAGIDMWTFEEDMRWMSVYRNFYSAMVHRIERIKNHLQQAKGYAIQIKKEANKIPVALQTKIQAINFEQYDGAKEQLVRISSQDRALLGDTLVECIDKFRHHIDQMRLSEQYLMARIATAGYSLEELQQVNRGQEYELLKAVHSLLYGKILGAELKLPDPRV